jgi:hypothetical protein
MAKKMNSIPASVVRQGDVLLVRIDKMPAGVVPVDGQSRKIVLALGEATGHHHRIEDHVSIAPGAADEIAEAAIARARLYRSKDGTRDLEVKDPVNLEHEEHATITLAPGIYELPVQCEYTAELVRRVQD